MQNFFWIYVFVLVLFVSGCSSSDRRPLSDEELAKLAKNFDLDREEFKKFRPGPIEEKFSVEKPEVSLVGAATPGKEGLPTATQTPKTAAKTLSKKASKTPAVQATPVPEKTAETSHWTGSGEDQFKGMDQKSQVFWSRFAPSFSFTEIEVIKVKYLGITIGEVTLKTLPITQIGGVDVYHLRGELKSSSYYEMLYKLDDTIESYVSKTDFLPIKYFLVQRESGKNIDDLQLFDHEKRKTYQWYKKEKKGEISKSEKQGDIPRYFQDAFSAFYYMRGLPLEKGLHYEFPVLTGGRLYVSKVDVVGDEKIHIMGKTVDAVKLRATNEIPGVDDKKDDMQIWFAADHDHRLLKFNTKIKLGSLEGEIVQYVP